MTKLIFLFQPGGGGPGKSGGICYILYVPRNANFGSHKLSQRNLAALEHVDRGKLGAIIFTPPQNLMRLLHAATIALNRLPLHSMGGGVRSCCDGVDGNTHNHIIGRTTWTRPNRTRPDRTWKHIHPPRDKLPGRNRIGPDWIEPNRTKPNRNQMKPTR